MSSMGDRSSHAISGSPTSETIGSRPLPSEGVDRRTGRAIPVPDSEWQERLAALEQELAEIDAQDETPEEIYERLMRTIDEERRSEGRPPAFQGQH